MQVSYTQHTKATFGPSPRGRGQPGGAECVGSGPESYVLPVLSLLGHSAPDEILGGEAVLHEHQPGPGELQQVLCCPWSVVPPAPHVSRASVLWGQWHAGNPFDDFLRGCTSFRARNLTAYLKGPLYSAQLWAWQAFPCIPPGLGPS